MTRKNAIAKISSPIRRPEGHNVKRSEEGARKRMKELGIPVPSIRKVREVHRKSIKPTGKRVGRGSVERTMRHIRRSA